jgi:hypothetical protein
LPEPGTPRINVQEQAKMDQQTEIAKEKAKQTPAQLPAQDGKGASGQTPPGAAQ